MHNLGNNVEFCFGKGVGRHIYDALNRAQQSIFVLTPYISQGYVDFLLRKLAEGIDIGLITTTQAQKNNMAEFYRKIIQQHKFIDEDKNLFKKKAKFYSISLCVIALLFVVSLLTYFDFHHDFKSRLFELKIFWRDESIFILCAAAIFIISLLLLKVFNRIKIFNYNYSTKFFFKVIPSYYDSSGYNQTFDSFLHAKIYIIDDKDIYIGSVNLTKSGISHNIESFVHINSYEKIKMIKQHLITYLQKNCNYLDTESLGKSIYHESPY